MATVQPASPNADYNIPVQVELQSRHKQLQGRHSWVASRQEGGKLMGHCAICAKHKDKLRRNHQKGWCLPYAVELYDNTYTDDDWNKVVDKNKEPQPCSQPCRICRAGAWQLTKHRFAEPLVMLGPKYGCALKLWWKPSAISSFEFRFTSQVRGCQAANACYVATLYTKASCHSAAECCDLLG